MDFFESQDRAKRKTTILIAYYILAVMLIVLAVYVAFVAVFVGVSAHNGSETSDMALWRPELFLWVAAGTLLVVVAGTAYKINQLSAGGKAVAAMLGGRPIRVNTDDPDEKRLLNVVEEVAIASGTAVPQVFLLEEEKGINAFAAGTTVDDAVVGVTRGCMTRLSRDELQGVIAHEFSHIMNGDMRLNIRLMGVLNGILVLGLLGYWVFRSSFYTSGRSRSRGKDNKLPIIVFGLVLMVVGYIGVFFGKLIKSAVSRQREYLADAAAVQFTRNPGGIAGALKKIGGWTAGSRITNAHAEEASHFFFCNGLSSSLLGLMATHPPLPERIRRIDASFTGDFPRETPFAPLDAAPGAAGVSGLAGAVAADPAASPSPPSLPQFSSRARVDRQAVLASIGAPQKAHMDYAARMMAAVPSVVMTAAHEPSGSRAIVYALLLAQDGRVRSVQMERLTRHADPEVYQETMRLAESVGALPRELRLPLVDIALASLTTLSPAQYRAFRDNIRHLTEADDKIDLFEYALQHVLVRHLDPALLGVKPKRTQFYSLRPLLSDVETLLSSLVHWGSDNSEGACRAFAAATARLGEDGRGLTPHPPDQCGLRSVDAALSKLAQAAPPIKKRIVDACVVCVAADGRVTAEEAELLRIVADALGCPIPPLLPDTY